MALSSNNDPYSDTAADTPRVRPMLKGDETRVTDTIEIPSGVITIEQGRAYAQGWHYSGFSGIGYLVRVNGEPYGQVATRREALDLANGVTPA